MVQFEPHLKDPRGTKFLKEIEVRNAEKENEGKQIRDPDVAAGDADTTCAEMFGIDWLAEATRIGLPVAAGLGRITVATFPSSLL